MKDKIPLDTSINTNHYCLLFLAWDTIYKKKFITTAINSYCKNFW